VTTERDETRPHDQHCAECDLAEFSGATYESAHGRPDSHAQCICGNGWTFDFQQKRVYCRACEAAS